MLSKARKTQSSLRPPRGCTKEYPWYTYEGPQHNERDIDEHFKPYPNPQLRNILSTDIRQRYLDVFDELYIVLEAPQSKHPDYPYKCAYDCCSTVPDNDSSYLFQIISLKTTKNLGSDDDYLNFICESCLYGCLVDFTSVLQAFTLEPINLIDFFPFVFLDDRHVKSTPKDRLRVHYGIWVKPPDYFRLANVISHRCLHLTRYQSFRDILCDNL